MLHNVMDVSIEDVTAIIVDYLRSVVASGVKAVAESGLTDLVDGTIPPEADPLDAALSQAE